MVPVGVDVVAVGFMFEVGDTSTVPSIPVKCTMQHLYQEAKHIGVPSLSSQLTYLEQCSSSH